MNNTLPSGASFQKYFAGKLQGAGFDVRQWDLVEGMDQILLAENQYYILAFQVFDLWSNLLASAGKIELAFSQIIGDQYDTSKIWDAYLVLVCRSDLRSIDEFNQLSKLVYDTHRTRKIVHTGLGNDLTRLDEVAKPFLSLTKVRLNAKGRDPLNILAERMKTNNSVDPIEIDRLISVFKIHGDLSNV
ncbi:MAG: hypothetical protein ABSB31_10470 [Dehalococcoidia bacterium]|jgi:hypothetical protein